MSQRPLVLMWDNFGPLHIDRINAVARHFSDTREVIGLELCGKSDTYDWNVGGKGDFRKETLFPDADLSDLGAGTLARALLGFAWRAGRCDYVMCHFDVMGVFLAAAALKLTRHRVFTMGCSKLDDKPRSARKEALKTLVMAPYDGALASGHRSTDFFRFLGVSGDRIVGEYNTVSLDRIRSLAGLPPMAELDPADGPEFSERDFISVARLVPKKNLDMLLEAYALYVQNADTPRRLHMVGSGPQEAMLKDKARDLGVAETVIFHGFLQTEAVSRQMAQSLALLLPSIEEQFGNVVPEAQALGLPVVLSDNAGARDKLVRTAKNGFVIEPDNPEGLAWYMTALASDETLWRRLRSGAFETAPIGDTEMFARGVSALINGWPREPA